MKKKINFKKTKQAQYLFNDDGEMGEEFRCRAWKLCDCRQNANVPDDQSVCKVLG